MRENSFFEPLPANGRRWSPALAALALAIGPPPGRGSDSPRRVKWLRSAIHAYAGDLAAWDFVGVLDPFEARSELLLASINLAAEINASRDEAITAANLEWSHGVERARRFVAALRHAIWQLGRMRAPGQQIIAQADLVNARFGEVLPSELLLEATRVVAAAASRTNVSRRRHA